MILLCEAVDALCASFELRFPARELEVRWDKMSGKNTRQVCSKNFVGSWRQERCDQTAEELGRRSIKQRANELQFHCG